MRCDVFRNYVPLFSVIFVLITLVTVFRVLFFSLSIEEKAFYRKRNIATIQMKNFAKHITRKVEYLSQIEYKPNVSLGF